MHRSANDCRQSFLCAALYQEPSTYLQTRGTPIFFRRGTHDLRTADHNGSPDIAGKTVRDYKRIEFQNKTIPNYAEMFSPLVLADRAVFVLLCIYFFFWPVWYASEEKLSVRIGEFRIEHLAVVVLMLLGLASLMRRRSF